MSLSLKTMAAAACLAATVPAAASASTFVGDEARFALSINEVEEFVVMATIADPGVEAFTSAGGIDFISADMSATQLTLTYSFAAVGSIFPTSWTVSGLSTVDGGTIADVTPVSGNLGLVSTVVTQSSVTIGIRAYNTGVAGLVNTFVFDIGTTPAVITPPTTGVTTPVPLPAGLPLALGGLAALGLLRRARRTA